MVNSIQSNGYYPTYYPAATASVATVPTGATGQAYSSDAYQASGGFDANKQASGMKRLFNGIGNAFGHMADWVGLGTISHYVKENF